MESLSESSWDVVISGTGLPQSLLALALSRSGKKILHVDQHDYYGGDEAAFSLSEAGAWALKHAGQQAEPLTTFSHASVTTLPHDGQSVDSKLASPRSYSLALAPQLLYARSSLLSALVSSRTHSQLEFQAVGSWFIITSAKASFKLARVPGGREDVFKDDTLDLKAKRSLMKFLRFVTNYEEQLDTWQAERFQPFGTFLQEKFSLPPASHAPILALTLSTQPPNSTTVEHGVSKVAKHLGSLGVFGAGFGAVLPKWGGLAEIGQVACRASAVGGGVYVLGRGVVDVQQQDVSNIEVQLTDGEKVTTQWLCGTPSELPASASLSKGQLGIPVLMSKSVSIVSSPLSSLFPPTSEGGVNPAGAVILSEGSSEHDPPVYLFAHSGEAGECPTTQCVIYASVAQNQEQGFTRLAGAVDSLLQSLDQEGKPSVLWCLQYQQTFLPSTLVMQQSGPVHSLQPLPPDLSLEDSVLNDVKTAWLRITDQDESDFMRFEARGGASEDDD